MSDKENLLRVRIPFAGFYCSIHDVMFSDSLEEINSEGERIGIDNVEWREAHLEYAQAYVKKLSGEIGLPMRFRAIESPSYYNCDTDRIYVNVDKSDLASLHQKLLEDDSGAEGLRAHVAEALRPRDGFIPYYSDDIDDWGDISEWNEAQMGVLIDFAREYLEIDEYFIAEDLSDLADELIWKHVRNPSIVPGHVDGPGM